MDRRSPPDVWREARVHVTHPTRKQLEVFRSCAQSFKLAQPSSRWIDDPRGLASGEWGRKRSSIRHSLFATRLAPQKLVDIRYSSLALIRREKHVMTTSSAGGASTCNASRHHRLGSFGSAARAVAGQGRNRNDHPGAEVEDYVLGRIRRLARTGHGRADRAGRRRRALAWRGPVHDGIEIAFEGSRHRIDFKALTGRTVTVYGQTEVTRDRWTRGPRSARRPCTKRSTSICSNLIRSTRGRYRKDGEAYEIACEYVAGCDGFHGVGRRSIPENLLRAYERVYPFGWLGVLVDQPPISHELIYVNHRRGFALCSMRSMTRSRYYLQCRLDEHVEDWPDEKFWKELTRPRSARVRQSAHRRVDRKEHRAPAQLRRRTDAVRRLFRRATPPISFRRPARRA